MHPGRPSETWVVAVHDALSGFRHVLLGQLVPGEDRYELVLTTRESPPGAELVEALWEALGALMTREDSPIAGFDGDERSAAWHVYPPLGELERKLFAGLDWAHAIVVHEWVD